jgi:hypothetical protein
MAACAHLVQFVKRTKEERRLSLYQPFWKEGRSDVVGGKDIPIAAQGRPLKIRFRSFYALGRRNHCHHVCDHNHELFSI